MPGRPVPSSWGEAPPAAQVAKKILGDRIRREQAPTLTNVFHRLYGTGVALLYPRRMRPLAGGVQKPSWRYPLGDVGLELAYHLVYGTGAAAAYSALR